MDRNERNTGSSRPGKTSPTPVDPVRFSQETTPGIRRCGPRDLLAVRRLLEDLSLCTEGLEDQFGDPYAVVEIGGQLVASAGLEVHGSYGLLRSVAVAPRAQQKGIGGFLVMNRLAWAKTLGVTDVYLLTTNAEDYFKRFGFTVVERADVPPEIGRTVEFSQACPESATVMRLMAHAERNQREVHMSDIKKEVRERYAEAARNIRRPDDSTGGPARGSCCGDEVSAQNAITSNLYDEAELKGLPVEAALASLGCGNPTALAELKTGEVVLDLGSGGGIDVILSAKRVGPLGKAYGLDMTDEMLEVARENQRKAGVDNVEFLKGEIEAVPLPDESVDVVISNCVINLSPDKRRVLRETFRVLKPGGRLAVADIVSRAPISEEVKRDMEMWTGCIAGALEDVEYREFLEEAGFEQIEIEPTRVFHLEKAGCCGGRRVTVAGDPSAPHLSAIHEGSFMSAFIRAIKPGGVE